MSAILVFTLRDIALHVSLIVMKKDSKNVGIAGNTNSNTTHIKVLIMKVREL